MAVLGEAAGDGRLTLEEHRERVAGAYRARTLGELAALTRDLAPASAQPLRLDPDRSIAAFFTTVRREGRWVVPGRLTVTAVGGHVILDLREAILREAHTIVQATLVGAQLHVLAPAGVTVTSVPTRGTWRAGLDPGPQAGPAVPPGVPHIDIRAFTAAGRVRVHVPRPARRRRWIRR